MRAWLLLIGGCAKPVAPPAPPPVEAPVRTAVEDHMGTRVELSALGAPDAVLDAAFADAFAEFDRLERLMSAWRDDSELGRVNAGAGGEPVGVGAEVFDLVERALVLAEQTDGAFDPTFASLWGLWTFGDDGIEQLPDPEEVERRRAAVDWRRVVLDPAARTIALPAGTKLGLGGLAKGYATDRAVAALRERGLQHFAVQAGGELYVSGQRGDRPWSVGVRDPRGDDAFAALELRDAAFDTSGDYERFFVVDGVRYHHIIDPATGWPATASRSATVLAPDATTADGLATALFVLGPERGLALVEARPGVDAVWVTADNEVVVSTGLSERLWIAHPPSP